MNDTLTVTALVQAAGEGDPGAWKSLVERYTPLVASVIVGYRLRGPDVEDVVQTVWLRLIEHLGDLREPRALPMWLITTARNECVRVLKAGQRTQLFDPLEERDDLLRGEDVDLDERLLAAERHQLLLAAFGELPEHHRELLLLLMADPPVPYAEISSRLGIPVGSIGPTRARALQRLRETPQFAASQKSDRANGTRRGDGHDFATLG